MWGGIYGDKYKEAKAQGYDDIKAREYATVNATLETSLQKALGGIKLLGGGKVPGHIRQGY